MNDIRKTGTVGVIEYEHLSLDKTQYLHFSEWWNGEGMDFTFNHGKKIEKNVSLHLDDIQALMTACIATGMVDVEFCQKEADEIIRSSKERENRIKEFNNLHKGAAF